MREQAARAMPSGQPLRPVIRLHPADNVVIARATLLPGAPVDDGVSATQRIPPGHKVAAGHINEGEPVRKYNQIIGFATKSIAAGEHVHVHNLGMGDFDKDYAYGVDAKPTDYVAAPATFQGIVRPDGRVATRNYIGILTSVNCSAHVASVVADAFKRNPFTSHDPLAEFENVDGVVALTHKTGCGMAGGEPLQLLRRTLGGYARHPNFSHVIVLGLGCEVNQIGEMLREQKLRRSHPQHGYPEHGRHPKDGRGGASTSSGRCSTSRTTSAASPCRLATSRSRCNAGVRTAIPACPSNPALGVARRPRRQARRDGDPGGDHGDVWCRAPTSPGARYSREVGEKLVELMHWWENYTHKQRARDQREPVSRQQGRRAHDHHREVARRDGQGGQHEPRRRREGTPTR